MSKAIRSKAFIIWLLAAGVFFFEYFARVAPSVMVPDLMHAFHVNALSLGALSALFYYSYVGMQLPVGALVDRFGAHKLLCISAGLCATMCFVFAETHQLAAADLARFIMGLVAAFAFVGTLKLARNWFSPARFGLLAAATQALGMLGAAIGEGPIAVLKNHIGWRSTINSIGFALLILTIFIIFIVRDRPSSMQTKTRPQDKPNIIKALVAVLKNKQCWINGIYVGCLYAPTAAFAELWGPSYLTHVYNLAPETAASAISMIFIGWAISGPIVGWISDKIKRRKPIMLISAFLSFIFMLSVLYIPNLSLSSIVILLFLFGASNVGVATAYTVASEIMSDSISATSMSFANMMSVLVGALFQPLIGALLQLNHGKIIDGVPTYSAHAYKYAMLSLPLCIFISLIAWLMLRESYGNNS